MELLLTAEGDDISDACLAILDKIFVRFDVDKDGHLSRSELNAFATATNGAPFTDQELAEIDDNFDMDEQGLTKGGFIQLYALQTSSEPEVTLKDFKALGYDIEKEAAAEDKTSGEKSSTS
ncbi:hypothetical protein BZG36_01477 [Bifiguratus adelaidae]|uniref:EF-hand domain-containing protein n=1 Tax=Bifiguratus adelaidae TaxID=1938954 RepID=A0A261Y4V1_9FUNG|nr:hypothetical protein BZG36_01477 [Bifiguratus adelaidae]